MPEPPESTSCPLFIKMNNTTVPIEDYLIGVIAGEMPASFHMEALKAQAIASRTYVLRQTDYGKKPILTTTAHQVYNDQELREEKWKTTFAENEEKITDAVKQTANQILTYNDELITAMFHASSFQYTESAENYSGNPIPYLTATTSPEQLNQEQTMYTFAELNKNSNKISRRPSFKMQSYSEMTRAALSKLPFIKNMVGQGSAYTFKLAVDEFHMGTDSCRYCN